VIHIPHIDVVGRGSWTLYVVGILVTFGNNL
jgi:hypothetical protein